jgi:ADP-dependent phosphofructokinase/glucokinase
MPRKKKQQVKVNNADSLEGLLQETYNEACGNINSAQREINKLDTATDPQDTDDYTKIAKSKTDLLKVKDSAIKIKLEVAKLQNDTIKQNGDIQKAIQDYSGEVPSDDDFSKVRDLIKQKGANDIGGK